MNLPKSRAKTAYGLLSDVKRAILKEPLRCNMRLIMDYNGEDATEYISQRPACGAVGCVAGWAEALVGRVNAGTTNLGQWHGAQILLDLSNSQAFELFMPNELLLHAHRHAQTPEHAIKVAEHITAFQAKYKDQLLATKIPASS